MVHVLIDGCPVPLSRKKLRQLMPRNHKALTGSMLAGTHQRSPGRGRFKSSLHDRVERLEKQAQQAASNVSLSESISTALSAINDLLRVRPKAQRVVKASRAQ